VSDFARAIHFYAEILGLKLSYKHEGEMCWAEFDIGGAALCLARMTDWKPSRDGCTVALEVADFDAALAHLRAQGVTITAGPFDTPVCQMAGFVDPDGNPLLIHRRRPAHA
jgi:predicted enzyme related to lactoylglutathione lyase